LRFPKPPTGTACRRKYFCVYRLRAAGIAMPKGRTVRHRFQQFATRTGELFGTASAFLIALLVVASWAVTGPLFHYSNTWQLWINTATTVITFLMVFVIQYTQNRDTRAMHLKLDELLRVVEGARTEMVNLKDLSDEELTRLEQVFNRLARFARRPREMAAETLTGATGPRPAKLRSERARIAPLAAQNPQRQKIYWTCRTGSDLTTCWPRYVARLRRARLRAFAFGIPLPSLIGSNCGKRLRASSLASRSTARKASISCSPVAVSAAPPPRVPPMTVVASGPLKERFSSSSSSHARR
jgi:low affinity Fe/Cu permease